MLLTDQGPFAGHELVHDQYISRVIDDEGEMVLAVPGQITREQALAVLRYGARCEQVGERIGRSTLQRDLRNLLGVASADYVQTIREEMGGP